MVSLNIRQIEASTVVVYIAGYLTIVFLSVCLATGLYYIAELVEECSQLAKRVITCTVEATLLLHLVLWLWDKLPLGCILTSAAAQVAYLRMLRNFPFFRVFAPDTAAAVGALPGLLITSLTSYQLLFLASNVVWWRWRFQHTWHSLEYVFGFYLMVVWLVPFALFISLAANEQTLPGTAGGLPFGGAPAGGASRGKGTRSFALSVFNMLKAKRDQLFPSASPERARLKPHTV